MLGEHGEPPGKGDPHARRATAIASSAVSRAGKLPRSLDSVAAVVRSGSALPRHAGFGGVGAGAGVGSGSGLLRRAALRRSAFAAA